MSPPPHVNSSSADKRDLLYVCLFTGATFLFAAKVELFEHLEKLVDRFERWQLDELVFAFLSLALGLAWYARRRRAEAVVALRRVQEADAHVIALLAHNRELAQQLIATQERERIEIARELHDDLGQCCNALRVEAEWIVQADAGRSAALQSSGSRLSALADDLYARVHALLRRLRPADLDALGLVAALQALCESWESGGTTVCVLHPQGSFAGLGRETEMAVYRVLQEALSNVRRHAKAPSVRVALGRDADGWLALSIRDDGVGFDAHLATRGLGLLGAAERAAALGGSFEVVSAPGDGTHLRLRLPGGHDGHNGMAA